MMMLHLLRKQVEQQLIMNLKNLLVVELMQELLLYQILLLMMDVGYYYQFDEQEHEMEDDYLLQLNLGHFYFVLD